MPDELFRFAEAAAGSGLKAIIAGAGGAAHLPGMLAAKTTVPVLGVPVPTKHLQGLDSLYSIVQMPRGFLLPHLRSGRLEPPMLRCLLSLCLRTKILNCARDSRHFVPSRPKRRTP